MFASDKEAFAIKLFIIPFPHYTRNFEYFEYYNNCLMRSLFPVWIWEFAYVSKFPASFHAWAWNSARFLSPNICKYWRKSLLKRNMKTKTKTQEKKNVEEPYDSCSNISWAKKQKKLHISNSFINWTNLIKLRMLYI